jgi:hypothetical protein
MSTSQNALDRTESLNTINYLQKNSLTTSKDLLSKKNKLKTDKENSLLYKHKKKLEGEESEREPETTGIFNWKYSKRQDTVRCN